MRYKLYENSMNNPNNVRETVLLNRGINDVKGYFNINDDSLIDYSLLDNINCAVECLLKHLEQGNAIQIIVDSDTDGYTSAAMLYSYIKLIEPEAKLIYSLHSAKQHGFTEDIKISNETKLVIVPDAGTNDLRAHFGLNIDGIDIIILDHHEQESYEDIGITQEEFEDMKEAYDYAIEAQTIIVNNQISPNYPNKNLCGAGIVYKFLQAVDDAILADYADRFLDLVALGNVADSMDVRSFETKRLIDKGIKNIRNKFFLAIIEKQSYSLKNKIDIMGIQWYISPLINSMIRMGSQEDKDLMFRAFIEQDEYFEYKKAGEIIQESIYDRVTRLCLNARQKQNKLKDTCVEYLCSYIDAKSLNDNKILFVPIDESLKNLAGVVAIRIAEKYKKPCLLLRQLKEKPKDNDIVFAGSGRGLDNYPIKSLKNFLIKTKCFDLLAGHDSAFGVKIKRGNIPKAIRITNERLKNIEFTNENYVDFILNEEEIDSGIVIDIANLRSCYGRKFEPVKIVIEDLLLERLNFKVIKKTSTTVKFIWNDEIEFIKFRCADNDPIVKWLDDLYSTDEISINVLGECSINEFGGKKTPQIKINEYEIANRR